jgi:hypothetical protein
MVLGIMLLKIWVEASPDALVEWTILLPISNTGLEFYLNHRNNGRKKFLTIMPKKKRRTK